MKKKIWGLFIGITISTVYANDTSKIPEKTTGNFANSRTPSTSFGFGQFIEDKGTLGLYLFVDQEKGKNQNYVTLCPLVVYSLTDNFSVYGSLPLIVSNYEDDTKSRGIGDLTLQFEYSFWETSNNRADSYATIVTNLTLPTASKISDEEDSGSLGADVPTFFLGATISTLSEKWYAYADLGATIIPTSYQGTKAGNEILYEWGLGYNLASWKDTVITMIVDFNGIYTQKDKTHGCPDNDTGGNIIYVGPTLFYSHKSWLFTGGIQAPALQHLNGDQNKIHFRTLFTLSMQFNT